MARFVGVATMTTSDPTAPGPYSEPIELDVVLNGARTEIAITSFFAIKVGFDTPLGFNVATLTRTSGGTGSYSAGAIVLPLGLHLDNSIDVPFFEEDSDLSVELTTSPPGSPVTPEPFGHVRLVGSGTFQGGYLGGSTADLTVDGTLSPPPPPTTVPDVRELRKNLAIPQIVAAGLTVRTTGTDGVNAWVFSQSPTGGTVVHRGSVVTLLLHTEAPQ